jgi:ribonuclease BN (tRNA processing enzyme)
MELIFLGSGSAFTLDADNFQSNMLLINQQGGKLLIDCGTDIRFSLSAAGLSYRDITDIYISHLHSDHAGGLEYMGFSTKFDPGCEKPNLYLSKELSNPLWNNTLSGGMSSLEGEIADLDTYFNLVTVDRDQHFIWAGVQFQLIKVVHVNNGYFVMPSYGLFFEITGVKVFLTTDTQVCLNHVESFYHQANIIFQDCETAQFPSHIHSHYQDLLKLPLPIRQKMWLYHHNPGILPDAQKDGFRGFVKRGQSFVLTQH